MKLPKVTGFTLIELVVVIGVLSVLLAIVLVAINPQRQFQQANDTQRRSDVNAILNAINQYAADSDGTVPSGITATVKTISSTDDTDNVNLCDELVPDYLADLPIDPTTGTKTPSSVRCDAATSFGTGYTASSSGTRVTVCATGEQTTSICVTR